jgi:L,D-transpeptidase ErfK/SrfK
MARLVARAVAAGHGAGVRRTVPDHAETGDLVGEARSTEARHEDTLIDIAREHNLGYDEIVNANPGVDPWLPGAGVRIELAKHRVLPMAERRGIVING